MRLEREVGPGLRVWCWDDLWRSVVEESARGPAWLSEAAARAALGEAIARARGDGALEGFAELLEWPGFRRRLRQRIDAWTRIERPVDAATPVDDPSATAQWAIFVRYRAILRTLDAEDSAGIAVWASRVLHDAPPRRLRSPSSWTFLDLDEGTPAVWRVLESAQRRAKSVRVTLAYEDAEDLAEVYSPHAPIRRRLRDWGFEEVRDEPTLFRSRSRPEGLAGVERELFRDLVHREPPLSTANGLTVIGAPQGEGIGLVLAREVRRKLDEGADPEDVLVLFRRWDDDAALVLETLRAWGLPVAATVGRPLENEPSVSALRLAMALPVEGWETGPLVRLLRHGRVRPDWPEARDPWALSVAASVVQASRIFRGRDALLRAIDRAVVSERAEERRTKAERARRARDVVGHLFGLLDPIDRPGRWREQVGRLRALAEGLGLGVYGDPALETLWAALDDQGAVLDDLGWGQRRWSWADFVREVTAMVGDLNVPPPDAPVGMVRLASIDEAAGARAAHVLVGNLAEGTFPAREAVAADLDRTPEGSAPTPDQDPSNPAFAREMLRFLQVIGSAGTTLVLVHPTTDPQGQELLSAGFLDDVLRLFNEETRHQIHTEYRRFDPALVDREDLTGAPVDARVRAVALACSRDDRGPLTTLAQTPSQRPTLEGTAAALRLLQQRNRSRGFDRYDGRLGDPGVLQRIAAKFGAEYPFSPSQLESYLFCPFQFYLRYVLKLEPVEERDELEEDFVERGSRIHRLLELLEQYRLQDIAATSRLELAALVLENEMRAEPTEGSAVETGLRLIEQRRLIRAVERYVRQHEAYEHLDATARPVPHRFEVVFGREDEEPDSYPGLVLGDGNQTVRLQGKIDRIDLLPAPGQTGFRVIDYKTGSCPSKKDVKESLYLQLPLYAMAVERLVLAGQADLHDVGYWGLSRDGYKSITLPDWADDQPRLEAFVIDLVNHLRHGVFPVDSRKDDCTQRCEYAAVCRVRQVRAQGKRREDVLRLELKIP